MANPNMALLKDWHPLDYAEIANVESVHYGCHYVQFAGVISSPINTLSAHVPGSLFGVSIRLSQRAIQKLVEQHS